MPSSSSVVDASTVYDEGATEFSPGYPNTTFPVFFFSFLLLQEVASSFGLGRRLLATLVEGEMAESRGTCTYTVRWKKHSLQPTQAVQTSAEQVSPKITMTCGHCGTQVRTGPAPVAGQLGQTGTLSAVSAALRHRLWTILT